MKKSTLCIAVLSGLALPMATGQAAPIDVSFTPPVLPPNNICVARAEDGETIAAWEAWDGQALPDKDPDVIQREMRRLRDIDAVAWFDTASNIIDQMPTIDPAFTKQHQTLANIDLYIAAGRLQELEALRLVHSLLEDGAPSSPRVQNALSEFLLNGLGIERDTERGMEFLVSAAYGGNADALLKLAEMTATGKPLESWQVDPRLTVTMAFGALVGQLDPAICDRISRIAREYDKGEIVAQNFALSEQWFRLAADLGDSNAAWKVAEYHMDSEGIAKDNDILVRYLTKAAEARLPYAEVELGRLFEAGSLVEQDLERAYALFRSAAEPGGRPALIRLAIFLELRSKKDPSFHAAYVETLRRLADAPDTPGWAYTGLATALVEEKGRWAAMDEVIPLLELAAEKQDGAGFQMLAQMLLARDNSDAQFDESSGFLIHSISNLGMIDPMADLWRAYLCQAPNAPDIENAAYWQSIEEAAGNTTRQFAPEELVRFAADPDALTRATVQSQALYGRPTALANYIQLLRRSGEPGAEQAFWDAYAERFDNVLEARGRLAMKLAQTPDQQTAALAILTDAMLAEEIQSASTLADALEDLGRGASPDLLSALEVEAMMGSGRAIWHLVRLAPPGYKTPAEAYAKLADVIAARGDYEALLFAIPHLSDDSVVADYQRKAVSVMPCDFYSVLRFAEAAHAIGDSADIAKWLRVAETLSEDNTWQMVKTGDTYLALMGDAERDSALNLYTAAFERSDRTATQRLLRTLGDKSRPDYDPSRIAELFVTLIKQSDPAEVPDALRRVGLADAPIQEAVASAVDIRALYEASANEGHPAAMREFAKILRTEATSGDDVILSSIWMESAAEAGDVEAMRLISLAYALGLGVETSVESATLWMRRAAEAGDAEAAAMMAAAALRPEVTQ